MLNYIMEVVSVEGFVLSTTDYKENSRILNVITDKYGIIGVISKGCKKMKSKLKHVSEKFFYGNFYIYYNEKGLSTLIDGDVIDYFFNIRSDINKISYLTYLTELINGVYKESNNIETYNLFIDGVRKIEEGFDPLIITNILEIQFLDYIGIGLNFDECVKCGSKKVSTISFSKGGFICSKCKTDEILYDEKIIKLLRLYYYVDISKINSLNIEKRTSNIMNNIINEYYDNYSGIHPKSKLFLKEVNII